MTWLQLQKNVLQIADIIPGDALPTTAEVREWVENMPRLANAALNDLRAFVKPLEKAFFLYHRIYKNMIQDTSIRESTKEPIVYTCQSGKSYYFEALGQFKGAVIYQAKGQEKTIAMEGKDSGGFRPYSGVLEDSDGGAMEIRLLSDYPLVVRNICVYDVLFPTGDLVPSWDNGNTVYDLKSLIQDFYELSKNGIWKDGRRTTEYELQYGHRLVLPATKEGGYQIGYLEYPGEITLQTPGDYTIPVDPEIIYLLELYIAGQLMITKDEDNAGIRMEEYEEGKRQIMAERERGRRKFTVDIKGM